MTDPVQTTQQTSDAVAATGVLGVIGVFLGAVAGLWRIVFGTRKERTDANERAAELALRAAEHAEDHAERADEQSAVYKRERLTCEEQLRAMGARIDRLERDHSGCGPRIEHLEREARLSRTMLADLMRNASTPPHGIYTPEDVRAALAAQEDTGP